MINIESERIKYVSPSTNYINDYLTMMNDRVVQSRLFNEPYHEFSYEDEYNWVISTIGEYQWTMITNDSNEFIGNCSFNKIDYQNGTGEIGIVLTPKMQHKGYGTETIKALIEYGFNIIGLNEIYLIVFSNNLNAINCYQKIGFVQYDIKYVDEEKNDIYMKYKK